MRRGLFSLCALALAGCQCDALPLDDGGPPLDVDAGALHDGGAATPRIVPSPIDVELGAAVQLSVEGGVALAWSSSDALVSSVDASGLLTGGLEGAAVVEAELAGGERLTAPVTVHPPADVVGACANADPTSISTMPPCGGGGGIFGDWIVDEHGGLAFEYTFDERNDVRGAWPNSENIERRDHFLVMGNQRLNFKVTDHGYLEVLSMDRGPTLLNRFAEGQQNLAGGFSYLRDNDDGEVFGTAHLYAPPTAEHRRVWGMGYVEQRMGHDGLEVVRTTWAPYGDDPVLLTEVTVRNTGASARDLDHVEYWDVNRHQLSVEWVRTGLGAAPSDARRDAHNEDFTQRVDYDDATRTLLASMAPAGGETPTAKGEAFWLDWYPPAVFLRALDGDEVVARYGDQSAFFGAGGAAAPDAVASDPSSTTLAEQSAAGQRAMLGMRHHIELPPGEERTLRFAYGYVPEDKTLGFVDAYQDPSAGSLSTTVAAWRERIGYAWVPSRPLFHRETAWRTFLLLSSTLYHRYYDEHYTPQGSAYLFLHGADGAARDQLLYAAPLAWLDPALARGNLRLVMGLTDSVTGQKGYAFVGHGAIDGAGLHEQPSDFDLYFFYALAEYLAATGDYAFLDEEVPYHPAGSGRPSWVESDSVLDHVKNALVHVRDVIGTGPHGLLRIRDGDWSDGIVYEDLSPLAVGFTVANGESVPNTQLALYALPLLAVELDDVDGTLATELRAFADGLRDAAVAAFGTRWFARAWLRNSLDQEYLKGNDLESDPFNASFIDLEAQPWGVLAGLLAPGEIEVLLDEVEARLDDTSSIGPRLREGGQVWPAISQLMTWTYARHRPASAWQSLDEQLYATHAELWPEQWIGIWSGPDGFLADGSDGGTWASPVTPMTDFPVANMNPEAMWLLGLLRTVGVEPAAGGFRVAPRGGGQDKAVLDLGLLRVEVGPARVRVVYRAHNDGSRTLRVATPPGSAPRVTVGGVEQAAPTGGDDAVVPLSFVSGESVEVKVDW